MKKSDLGSAFRSTFGLPVHYKQGELVPIDTLLATLSSLGVNTSQIKYARRTSGVAGTVLKLQVATGSGRNRKGRELHFNRDQKIVYDFSQSLDTTGGDFRTFRGFDPRVDTGDYIE